MEGEMTTLQADVIGPYSGIAYGLAGDRVRIISDHDNVMIVEGESGKRFPLKKAEYFKPENYKSDTVYEKRASPLNRRFKKVIKQEIQKQQLQNQLFNL